MIGQGNAPTIIPRVGVAVVAFLCVMATIGWTFGVPVFASIIPGLAPMSVPSILCFLLSGAAVMALALPAERIEHLRALRTIALFLVAVVGFLALADFIVKGGLAGSALSERSGYVLGVTLGRMAPATAFNFVIVAAALSLPPGPHTGRIYGRLIATGLAVTALAATGYAYGVETLYEVAPFSAMALPTTICFALLFGSALIVRPGDGWIATVLANDSGGVAARRLLPAVVGVPFALVGLLVAMDDARAIPAPFGFALLAVATAMGLSAITVVMAGRLAARETEQRRNQRLIEAIVENSPAVIYVKDLAGRYLMVNRRYADIFQIDRAEVIGKTDHDVFQKDTADAFRAMDERVVAADAALTEEETAPLDDGLHSYVSVKTPLRDDSGRAYAVFGISTDITEQRRAEEAFHASQQRNRLIVETALDAIITIDRSGRITEWSRQAGTMFGWSQTEALGRPVDETIMPDRYREAHRLGLARYLATGEAKVLNQRIELTALRRDGQEFPVELSITPIHEGAAVSFCAFVRDITERKRVEERQRALLDELNHRVKNTLASVQSIALLSRHTAPSPELYYESIDGRLAALASAHDLLTHSSWESASLKDILERTLAPYADPARPGALMVDGPPVRLSPNAALTLHMAFHEMATNAAKYGALSETSGRLNVHWRETDASGNPTVELLWHESGGPEVRPTERRGFGLRMVKQGVERELEGKVELSLAQTGLRCTITLPVSSKVMPA